LINNVENEMECLVYLNTIMVDRRKVYKINSKSQSG